MKKPLLSVYSVLRVSSYFPSLFILDLGCTALEYSSA